MTPFPSSTFHSGLVTLSHTHTLFPSCIPTPFPCCEYVLPLPQPCPRIKPKTMFTHKPTFRPSGKHILDLFPKLPLTHKEHIVLAKPGLRPNIPCITTLHGYHERGQPVSNLAGASGSEVIVTSALAGHIQLTSQVSC